MENPTEDNRLKTSTHTNNDRLSKSAKIIKNTGYVILFVTLIASSGLGAYLWRDKVATEADSQNAITISGLVDEINNLTNENNNLNEQLTAIEKLAEENENLKAAIEAIEAAYAGDGEGISGDVVCTPTTNGSASSEDIENIEASISIGNTAALESYMADSVCFALAASEGPFSETKAEAVQILNQYLTSGETWNFSPSESEMSAYESGWYSDYFADRAVIGVSDSGKTIVISFDVNGKISTMLYSWNQEELM